MAIKVKKGGVYADPAGIFAKKAGVYSAVAGVSAKVGGAYVNVGTSLASQVAALFAAGQTGRAYWDVNDLTTLSADTAGTAPATLGGEVRRVADKGLLGRHFTAAAGTAPVLAQRADGVYYLDFAGGKTMSVPASTALFNYLHNGAGGTLLAKLEWFQGATTSQCLQTCIAAGTQTGFILAKVAANQNIVFNLCRSSASITGQGVFALAGLSSALRFLRAAYKNDGTASDVTTAFDAMRTKAGAVTQNAPSVANASTNLTVSTDFGGRFYGAMIFEEVISDANADLCKRYFDKANEVLPAIDYTVLIGGQSNAEGQGAIAPTTEEKAVGAYMFNRAEEFRLALEPLHSLANATYATVPVNPTVKHSAGLRFAKYLKADSGKNVLLVPCAVGSTSIAQWDTPATVGDKTTLFGSAAYRYGQAAVKSGAPVLLWYGHEASATLAVGDYTNGGVGSAYQSAWTQLIADVRANVVDAPLIFCQLSADDLLADSVKWALAGEAQRQTELTIPNAWMVVTHDLKRNVSPDDIHVAEELPELGRRMSLAFRQHILGEAVNGTGPRIVGATYAGSTVTLTCDKEVNASAGNYGNLFRVYAAGVEQTVSSAVRNAETSKIDILCSVALSGAVTLTYGHRAGQANAVRTDVVMDADSLPLPLFGPIVATP